ncbi:hypothetical protein AN7157.2 [Aspergillus nidulans FGSC A4]|uniref:Uncharacterized protein n=1 Tax=Emericella nidulans (strain FGSC A4 / ATCC 38163 / CBS 112.46 / NRRL 194 / M139) TaxID=227321 RepID=Q5AX23_EMENI|nr:hypothetical protein [Aspergillus nidulans FGSC A4]EAA61409.1 hypothetical protein AN7157.2 [Aspergillus nidulans FGSC A4]CBF78963.1 TPA: conserved hypothetical protein [Aspergillus nidulans FGSC A4]|eukprot:XP_664761.1 hypothetical protein AN7157.2 [Aspergillus nidulans FGSC A4]
MTSKQSPSAEQIESADYITPAVETVPKPTATAEKAAQFLATTAVDRSFTPEEEKAVRRRIDSRVLPLLLGAYFFQQLDKSSLSYVSIFGLVEDANLVGQQYSWLGSILYLAQLVMFILVAIIAVIADLYLYWLNKRHARRRQELGKNARVVDESMLGKAKIQQSKAAAVEDGAGEEQKTEASVVDKGFQDTTDLKNEDFIYVY